MKKIGMREFAKLAARRKPYQSQYYAMYSSVYGGIVTDPGLMLLPMDDHIVIRGDGVFEAIKCCGGNIYNLQAHLQRLGRSAAALSLRLPQSLREIGRIIRETIRVAEQPDNIIRLYVSRGPGSFGADPYDCPESQLYIVITKMDVPFMEKHPEGARVGISRIPIKPPFFARVKSCNYLQNVLMKKEAVDAGLDCVVALQPNGCLGEGPTENFGIVTASGRLVFPKVGNVLRGTTMLRTMDLAGRLVKRGELKGVGFADFRPVDVRRAREAILVGTTRDVTLVREFDGRSVGKGKPGPVFQTLSTMLLDDIRSNRKVLTAVW